MSITVQGEESEIRTKKKKKRGYRRYFSNLMKNIDLQIEKD